MSEEKKKPINISFSKIDTYLSCPMKYKLQHKDYLVPNYIPSPFLFGGATDDATSEILFSKAKGDLHVPFNKEAQIALFTSKMTHYRFQGEDIYVPTSPLIKYAGADIDVSLLTEDDIFAINSYAETLDISIDNIEEAIESIYQDLKKDRDGVDEDVKSLYNFIAWKALYNKGLMMLEAFNQWVEDNIEEVHSVQRKIELVNDEGDVLRGAMDFEATYKDGVKRTTDLKTASNAVAQYPDNCIETSMQLHIYSQESNPDVNYVVIDKSIRKKEPRVRIREVRGSVTEEMLDKTFDTIDNVMYAIRNEEFPMNKDACFRYGLCDFHKLCHKGKMEGLVKRVFENNGK